MAARRKQIGNAVIEFTFIGIPLMFVLISVFEMARGMWVYHTLAYAIKEGTRFAIVHGHNCAIDPHDCAVRVSDIAARIKDAGVGLDPAVLKLRFTSVTRAIPEDTLENYLANNAYWPTYAKGVTPADTGGTPGNNLTITGTYVFQSAIAMFWPGAGPGTVFGSFNLPASSTERIQF